MSAGSCRPTCLAPDIVEAILDGRQPRGLRLAEMLRGNPARLGGAAADVRIGVVVEVRQDIIEFRSALIFREGDKNRPKGLRYDR
jgi:hypothetical protein